MYPFTLSDVAENTARHSGCADRMRPAKVGSSDNHLLSMSAVHCAAQIPAVSSRRGRHAVCHGHAAWAGFSPLAVVVAELNVSRRPLADALAVETAIPGSGYRRTSPPIYLPLVASVSHRDASRAPLDCFLTHDVSRLYVPASPASCSQPTVIETETTCRGQHSRSCPIHGADGSTSSVTIEISLVKVRWTGHLSAISSSLRRCSGSSAPSKAM